MSSNTLRKPKTGKAWCFGFICRKLAKIEPVFFTSDKCIEFDIFCKHIDRTAHVK